MVVLDIDRHGRIDLCHADIYSKLKDSPNTRRDFDKTGQGGRGRGDSMNHNADLVTGMIEAEVILLGEEGVAKEKAKTVVDPMVITTDPMVTITDPMVIIEARNLEEIVTVAPERITLNVIKKRNVENVMKKILPSTPRIRVQKRRLNDLFFLDVTELLP